MAKEFEIKDYTKQDIGDDLVAKDSVLNDFEFTDNMTFGDEFEGVPGQDVIFGGLRVRKKFFAQDIVEGIWMGIDTDGQAKMNIGNEENFFKWNGQAINILGALVNGDVDGNRVSISDKSLSIFRADNTLSLLETDDGIFIVQEDGSTVAGSIREVNDGIQIGSSETMVLGFGGNDIDVYDRFLPQVDENDIDIGSGDSGRRFRTIYLINSPDVSSSKEGKEKIQGIGYGLDTILKMKPVSFKRKKHKDRPDEIMSTELGFLAEDLHKIAPEVATMKSMKPDHLIPILVRGIQQLSERIDILEGNMV